MVYIYILQKISAFYIFQVYNEGFEIKLQNNISLLVFNKYFFKDGEFLSNCAKTIVGWYQDSKK